VRLGALDRQLLRELAKGATNREIAARLGRREQTVKNRLTVLYRRLGVRNRLELVVKAGVHLRPDRDGWS
jgi:two-component system, NarL family, nitrate/nitrite response regulator NarL